MARRISIVLTMAVLTALFCSVQVAGAAEYGAIENSISDGLSWLAAQQNSDGSWGTSPAPDQYGDRVARTGLAVMVFIDYARKFGMDPFDPSYQYFDQVDKGIVFLRSMAALTTDGSVWDVYPFGDEVTLNKVYETSIAIMALSRTEDSPQDQQILQAAVDYLVSAQNIDGGWSRFEAGGYGNSDQFDTGFAALALGAAMDSSYAITVGPDVFESLAIWVEGSQDSSGGAYYMPPTTSPFPWWNMLTTGHLLSEMTLTGDSGESVQDAINFMSDSWANDYAHGGWQMNYPAIFATMTGLTSQGIPEITVDGTGVNWFDEMSTAIVNDRTQVDEFKAYWDDEISGGILYGDRIFDTELALLTLLAGNPPVVGENSPPNAAGDSYSTDEDTLLTVPAPGVLWNDQDAEQDPLTAVLVNGPGSGALTLNSIGSFTYLPNANFFGTDSFTYKANDGEADSGEATVTITVNPVNHPPDVTPAYPSLACLWPPNHTLSDVTIRGVTDADGDPITIAVTGVTSDEPTGSVTGAGGKTHAPDAIVNGGTVSLLRAERSGNSNGRVYAISFTASDGKGGVSSGTVKVNVPHSQSDRCQAVDDGQKYDATAVN